MSDTFLQTGHVGLNVSNLERSKNFYQTVFGLSVTAESQEQGRRFAFLADSQRLVLTLWEQSEGHFEKGQPGLHHLSFEVATIDEVHTFEKRLKELDATFLYDGVVPHREGASSGGIFFADPDGIRLEIYTAQGADTQPAPVSDSPTCGFF